MPARPFQAQPDNGFRLVNQAKGIYKPHYTEYALSVRQTLDGPYADKDVEWRPDGSWVYPYFQENPDPAQRNREATNRGLMQCMEDSVPIGVLLQTKPKPGVQYRVLGLALVTDWQDGYFILEGFSDAGEAAGRDPDAAHHRAVAATLQQPDFQADSVEDARERQIAEVIRRRGQGRFRAAVMAAYGRKCAVTNCDAAKA
jgi:putative restriction endonuclease